MEKPAGNLKNVMLLDNYGEESRLLHQSFKRAGFDGITVVLSDDGFLPDDVISPYGYFCGDYGSGKARFFNQINVPDLWEISGSNSNGKVHDMGKERGRIFYAQPAHRRLVKTVDWLDDEGNVRSSDHYNSHGVLYARTAFNKKGKKFCRSYFDKDGKEIIVENYVTGSIILNRDGKVHVFSGMTEFALKLFEELDAANCRLFYNSLSTSLFISQKMPENGMEDILFWQEDERDDIPGNMQLIFDGGSKRTGKIYVQKKDSFRKLISLGAPQDMAWPLGFAYDFKRENGAGREALICTNSDNIRECEHLISSLPWMKFSIAAITEMSSKLMSLAKYDNVALYPAAKMKTIDRLFDTCDFYLDINYGNEIVSAVKRAFLNNQLVIAFKDTVHDRRYTAKEHVFDDAGDIIQLLEDVRENREKINRHILIQQEEAMTADTKEYACIL